MVGEAAAVAAAMLWAVASLIFARLGRDDVSPLAMNLLKCLIAFVLLLATLGMFEGRIWPGELSYWNTAVLAVSGFIGLTFGDTAFFASLTRIGSRRALLLRALTPPITAVLAVPVLAEPLTLKMAAGIALTVGGVIWVIMEREPSVRDDAAEADPDEGGGFSREEWVGLALGVAAALFEAVGQVLTKMGGGDIPALDISIVRLALGTAGLGLVVGMTGRISEVVEPMKIPRKAWLLFVATMLGTYLGIWFSMAGIRYTYTGVASTLSSTSPVWILPLAHYFEDDRISLRAVAGAVIAVAGIGLLFLRAQHFGWA
jgi:drug/metabolite transporter (DMT)-like permease